MPQIPYSIELHDSTISSIQKRGDTVIINLRPAYIHRDEKGWVQNADVVLGNANFEQNQIKFPLDIMDGSLKTNEGVFNNHLLLPLNSNGPAALKLELSSGEMLEVIGKSIAVNLLGEPKYVEDVR
jgi:hypothetical protein